MSDETKENKDETKKDQVEDQQDQAFIGRFVTSVTMSPLRFGFRFLEILTQGFILSKMWLWFVCSQFQHAPKITYVHAVGVVWIVNFVLNDMKFANDISNKAHTLPIENVHFLIAKSLINVFVRFPITYFLAWLWWKLFVLKQ